MKQYFGQVVEAVLQNNVLRATKFIDSKTIIRATRKRFHGKIVKRGNVEMMVTVGRPNYAERNFIKTIQKAKEPFPVKKVLLKIYDPKKTRVVKRSR